MKSETVADIILAMLGVALVALSWDSNGSRLFQTGLMCGGVFIGYIMTTYLNKGEDE